VRKSAALVISDAFGSLRNVPGVSEAEIASRGGSRVSASRTTADSMFTTPLAVVKFGLPTRAA
jgi:hypothetical protein